MLAQETLEVAPLRGREERPTAPRYEEVYSTKDNAKRIGEKRLQEGERITVTGWIHKNENQEETIYALGVKRLEESHG